MLDVITIGGATRDIFFRIEGMEKIKAKKGDFLGVPYGSKIVSSETFYSYGGGSVNAAVSFSRLGLKSAASCAIGREGTGSLLVDYLKSERVGISHVLREIKSHTGLSVFVLGADSEHTGFLERGANNDYRFNIGKHLRPARWFYVSSLTGKAAHELPKIFRYAARKNIKIAFNPGSAQLALGLKGLKDYLAQTEILILNKQEAVSLLGKGEIENLLKKLAKQGPNLVVITESEKGCWALKDGQIMHQPSLRGKVVDTTGAGDAFGSTFVFGLIKGFAVEYSLKIASLNAASVISKMGAGDGLLTYRKIKESSWL